MKDEEFEALYEAMQNHPAKTIHLAWLTLQRSVDQTSGLGTGLVNELSNLPRLSWQDKKGAEGLHMLLSMYLESFCYSMTASVDRARHTLKGYDEDLWIGYTERVDKLILKPSTVFLRDLRNYLSHYREPRWIIIISSPQDTALLSTQHMLSDGYEWKPKSRRLLEDNPKGIDIKPILEEYLEDYSSLWNWTFTQQNELVESVFEDYNQKVSQFTLGISGGAFSSPEEYNKMLEKSFRGQIQKQQEPEDDSGA